MPTLEDLLMALQQGGGLPALPPPAQPMSLGPIQPPNTPQYGGPSTAVEPPVAPYNQNIANQYMQALGPAPVAPAPPSTLQRISNALIGFGAGVQGNGAQFLQQLQEPQRRYEAQTADYNQRREALRLRGTEVALDRQERETRRAQALADREFEMEFQRESRRLGLADSEAHERLRQSFELQKQAAAFAAEEKRELAREQRAREIDAKQIASRYFTATKNMALSRELGRYYSGLSESLSPQAAKLDAHVQGAAGTGGGRSRTGGASNAALKALQNFESAKQGVIAAIQRGPVSGSDAAKRGAVVDERAARRRLDQAYGRLAAFPGQIQFGLDSTGAWPWAKLVQPGGSVGLVPQQGVQRPQQPQGKTISRAEMAALGISEAEAKSEGYTITP